MINQQSEENKLLTDDTFPKGYDNSTETDCSSSDNAVVDVNVPLLTTWEIITLNLSFFGLNLLVLVLSVQVVPAQVMTLVGPKLKGTFLGVLVALGAIITLVTGPTVGMYSDRLVTRFGRRRPLMFVFTIVLTIGIIGLASSAPYIRIQGTTPMGQNSSDINRNGTICQVNLEYRRCRPYYYNSTPYWNEFYQRHKSIFTEEKVRQSLSPKGTIEDNYAYFGLFVLFYCIMVLGYIGIVTPYHALVADRTHPDQRGICSGVLGGMVLLGNISGAALGLLVAQFGVVPVYIISLVITLLCLAVTHWFISEFPVREKVSSRMSCTKTLQGYWKPFEDHNFKWVFITRFLIHIGLSSTVGYLEFWLHDMIPLPYCWTPIHGVSFMLLPLLVFAAITSILSGILSDEMHVRKSVIMAASFIMCVLDLSLAVLHGNSAYYIAVGLAVVFGFAYGSYQAMDFALLMDVLPDPDETSRDIAVWQQALNLSQALGVPAAGIIVDLFQRLSCSIGLGYIIMFILCGLFFLLSSILLTKIRL